MAVFGPFLRFEGWKWGLKGTFFGVGCTVGCTFGCTRKNEMCREGVHLGVQF